MTTNNPTPTQPETLERELFWPCKKAVCGECGNTGHPRCAGRITTSDGVTIICSCYCHELDTVRAAVTAPRGDAVDAERLAATVVALWRAENSDDRTLVKYIKQSLLGARIGAAATASPTPAESDLGYEQWSRTDNWPISDVLNTLASATEHLLRDHNCDEQGHETWKYAAEAARKHVSLLAVPAERACLICGHNDLDADGITCAAPVPICSDDHHGLRHCGCKCKFTEQSYSEGFDDAARVARVLSNVAISDSARLATREWMDTYHAAFKTNQEREDALVAIISKHFAAAPADNDAE